MNFKKEKDSIFLTGYTDKGHLISFVPTSEDKLRIAKNNKFKVGEKIFIEREEPSKIIFYTNFQVTTPMIDELEKSKIIEIVELDNENRQIIAHPLAFFDYSKIQDILHDLSVKFNL